MNPAPSHEHQGHETQGEPHQDPHERILFTHYIMLHNSIISSLHYAWYLPKKVNSWTNSFIFVLYFWPYLCKVISYFPMNVNSMIPQEMVHHHEHSHHDHSSQEGWHHHHMAGHHHLDNQGLALSNINNMNTINNINGINTMNTMNNMNNLAMGMNTMHSMGMNNINTMGNLQNISPPLGSMNNLHMSIHQSAEIQQLPSLASILILLAFLLLLTPPALSFSSFCFVSFPSLFIPPLPFRVFPSLLLSLPSPSHPSSFSVSKLFRNRITDLWRHDAGSS